MFYMQKQLISININTGTYRNFVNELVEMSEKNSTYTCIANVHMLVEAYSNASFASIINNADMITPDGIPLTWGLKLLHGVRQDRVAGMDLLPDLLKEAERKSIPVYFYGGPESMLARIKEKIPKRYPSLKIAGMFSPPFRDLSMAEVELTAQLINNSGAKIILVILGCPKQELWMGMMKNRINGTMIGVGGALPVLLGIQKRAPVWMQRNGLEWTFRLWQEPRRLFKRYAVTNSIFIFLLTKEFISIKIFRQKGSRFSFRNFGDK
jgi:N-acetylglucosaminyldiphosphoundecaprenol N-acetyl-beta-D-mannosaminyltransferase